MNKDDIAYAAGFFDAEGCNLISKQKGTIRMIHPRYSLQAKIGVTNQLIMSWFKEQFGGSLSILKGKKQKKIFFHWQISTRLAEIFLRQIFPYLRLKKPQAELAFQFQNEMRKKKQHKQISPESLRLREKIKNQISALNQKHSQEEFKSTNECKIAYAAGFFDGDGYIKIRVQHRNLGLKSIHYLEIGIGSFDHPITNWFKQNFEGCEYTEKYSESQDNFRWRIGSDSAENFLQQILPYLRLKIPQAELAIRFQKAQRIDWKRRIKKRNEYRQVTPEFLEQRERIRQQMLALNRNS